MKLATLANGSRDGRLVVVSADLRHAVSASDGLTGQNGQTHQTSQRGQATQP